MRHRSLRRIALLVGVIAALALAAPVGAITNGQPDAEEHPYVGQLFFYDADYVDSRFDDPGGWFNCSGTLISPHASSSPPATAPSAPATTARPPCPTAAAATTSG